MKKTILVTSLTLAMAATPALAQMMDSGQASSQQMMEQQQRQQAAPTGGQYYPQYMNPGMMGGGYGYNMGPQMMGGYGYGSTPNMMGSGYGPGMMSGYGYGMTPNMMGGYGYGMTPNMMGYGMHPGMMGGYGMYPGQMGYGTQEDSKKYQEKQEKFFTETKDLRRKMHGLMFDFSEAARNPEGNREQLKEMEKEMFELQKKLRDKAGW